MRYFLFVFLFSWIVFDEICSTTDTILIIRMSSWDIHFKSAHSCRICARRRGERYESLQRACGQVQELLDMCEDDW